MTPRLAQLYAVRAQIDALILAEESEQPVVVDPMVCPNCGAPEDKQQRAGGMGGKVSVLCTVCKQSRVAA